MCPFLTRPFGWALESLCIRVRACVRAQYYTAGLQSRNDIALSIFAPQLVFAHAHAAFAAPIKVHAHTHASYAYARARLRLMQRDIYTLLFPSKMPHIILPGA